MQSCLGLSCIQETNTFALKYAIKIGDGALAQLVARFNGIEEVTSSNLVRSTNSVSLLDRLFAIQVFIIAVLWNFDRICLISRLNELPALNKFSVSCILVYLALIHD